MNDLERDLRELLGSKAGDAAPTTGPSPRILRRARRRQVGTVITTLVVVAAVIVGSVAALQTVLRKDPSTPQPATPPVLPEAPPGFSSAALPFASIAYPTNWYLLDTSPLVPLGVAPPYVVPSGPVLQLANFDPDLPHAPRCMVDPDALPRDGVLLTVGVMTTEEAAISNEPSGPWPVDLIPLPSNQDPVCVGGPRPRIATWTAPSGLIYWANAGHGADASEADIRKMEQAFAAPLLGWAHHRPGPRGARPGPGEVERVESEQGPLGYPARVTVRKCRDFSRSKPPTFQNRWDRAQVLAWAGSGTGSAAPDTLEGYKYGHEPYR